MMGAEEFAAQLAADPEYQRKRAAFNEDLEARVAVWGAAEEPIVVELRAAGLEIDSVWDLVNTATPYSSALPILIRHLERSDLPDRVLESIGRALAVKPSIDFWDRLIPLMISPSNAGQGEGAAVAVAACANAEKVDHLIQIIRDTEPVTRFIYLLRPISNHGGERGKQFVGSLTADPVLGIQAKALSLWPTAESEAIENAIDDHDTDQLRELLHEGADPHTVVADLQIPAIAFALMVGFVPGVKLLAEFGADIELVDTDGRSELARQSFAADDNAVVGLLLRLGANYGAVDDNGWTALHHAAACGYSGTVRTLISAGASTQVETVHGLKPADLAETNHHTSLAKRLRH